MRLVRIALLPSLIAALGAGCQSTSKLYWVAELPIPPDEKVLIKRADLETREIESLPLDREVTLNAAYSLDFDRRNERLIWGGIYGKPGGLNSCDLDGENHRRLPVPHTYMHGTAVDAGQNAIFWTAEGHYSRGKNRGVWRCELDGRNPTNLLPNAPANITPRGLTLDRRGKNLFFASGKDGSVYRLNYSGNKTSDFGSATRILHLPGSAPRDLAFYKSPRGKRYLFLTISGHYKIYLFELGSGGSIEPITGQLRTFPHCIAIDQKAEHIYWGHRPHDGDFYPVIHRASLSSLDLRSPGWVLETEDFLRSHATAMVVVPDRFFRRKRPESIFLNQLKPGRFDDLCPEQARITK